MGILIVSQILIFTPFVVSLLILNSPRCVQASTCYTQSNNSVFKGPDFITPCGDPTRESGFLPCCGNGEVSHEDVNNTCTSNGICRDVVTGGANYYLSLCTDPSYSSSVCPQACRHRQDPSQLNIRYDDAVGLWKCCSGGDRRPDCQTSGESFSAPRPAALKSIYSIPGIIGASSSSQSTSPPTDSQPTANIPSQTSTSIQSIDSSKISSLDSASATPSKGIRASSSDSTASLRSQTSNNASGPKRIDEGMSSGNKISLGVGLGLGIPALLAAIVGAYYTWKTYRDKKTYRNQKRIGQAGLRNP